MTKKQPMLIKHIGFRVKECVFAEVERLADSDGKSVNDWCRDRLLDILRGSGADLVKHALLAEIAATQSITVSLFFAFARDGKLPEQKVREILDRAQKKKYDEASDLIRQAQAWRLNGNSSADIDEQPTRRR